MDSRIIIRTANVDDSQALGKLYQALFLDQAKYDPRLKLDPKFEPERLLRIMLLNGRHKFFVAVDQERIVGFFQVNIFYGDQLLQIMPSELEGFWKKLHPLRLARKALKTMLNWLEPRVEVPPTFEKIRAGYLANSYVLPEYQGQGIYRRFSEQALEFLRQHKVDIVYFNAYLDNQIVINFWKKQGFKISKVIMTKDL